MEFYATLGPACSSPETLDALFRAGMTGARLNLSHVALADSRPLLEGAFRPAARRAGRPGAHLILDLQGPELRVGRLARPLALETGGRVLLGEEEIPIPPGGPGGRPAGGSDLSG